MATTTTSKQFTISIGDVGRGLLMAVIVPVLTIVSQSLDQGSLTFNWKAIGIAAIAGGIGYLMKNFLTPSKVIVTDVSKETVAGIKDGSVEMTPTTKP